MIKSLLCNSNIQEINFHPKINHIIHILLVFFVFIAISFSIAYQITDSYKSVTIDVIKDKNEVIINQKQFLFGEKEVKLNLSDIEYAKITTLYNIKYGRVYNISFKLNSGEEYKLYSINGPNPVFMYFVVNKFNNSRYDKTLASYRISSDFKIKDLLNLFNIKNLNSYNTWLLFVFIIFIISATYYLLKEIIISVKIIIDTENKEFIIIYNRILKREKKIKFSNVASIGFLGSKIAIHLIHYSGIIYVESFLEKEKITEVSNYLKSFISSDI